MVIYRGTFPEKKRKYIKDGLFVQSQRILENKKKNPDLLPILLKHGHRTLTQSGQCNVNKP